MLKISYRVHISIALCLPQKKSYKDKRVPKDELIIDKCLF